MRRNKTEIPNKTPEKPLTSFSEPSCATEQVNLTEEEAWWAVALAHFEDEGGRIPITVKDEYSLLLPFTHLTSDKR
jgi:hypothetical protein